MPLPQEQQFLSLLQMLEMMGACPAYPPLQAPDAVPGKQGIVSEYLRGVHPHHNLQHNDTKAVDIAFRCHQ